MAELRLRNVTKSFGDTSVIRGVDLEVRNGEFMVFVGPSGCGKSTLLRLIAGLEMVTDGQVQIDGQDVTRLPASDRGLAMVFQSYALYPHMSVRQNMGFALENMRLPKAEVTARVERAAQMLQLAPYLDRKPRALSGGQRQRVAIGRAIVRDPKIFLFDEPLSNLDAELRVATRKELAALHAEIGGTMIYVTHDQVEAMTLADRIVVLRGGLIEQVGTPLELYNNPAGSGGALAVEGREIRLDLPGGLREGEPVTFGVRPEHLEPTGEGGDLEAHVDLLEQLGSETYLYASAPGLPQICVRQEGQLGLARGDTVRLRARRDAIHLFNSEGLALRAMQGTGHLA